MYLDFANVSSVLSGDLVKSSNLALREGGREQPLTSLISISKL